VGSFDMKPTKFFTHALALNLELCGLISDSDGRERNGFRKVSWLEMLLGWLLLRSKFSASYFFSSPIGALFVFESRSRSRISWIDVAVVSVAICNVVWLAKFDSFNLQIPLVFAQGQSTHSAAADF
jgi:hypothetical protein